MLSRTGSVDLAITTGVNQNRYKFKSAKKADTQIEKIGLEVGADKELWRLSENTRLFFDGDFKIQYGGSGDGRRAVPVNLEFNALLGIAWEATKSLDIFLAPSKEAKSWTETGKRDSFYSREFTGVKLGAGYLFKFGKIKIRPIFYGSFGEINHSQGFQDSSINPFESQDYEEGNIVNVNLDSSRFWEVNSLLEIDLPLAKYLNLGVEIKYNFNGIDISDSDANGYYSHDNIDNNNFTFRLKYNLAPLFSSDKEDSKKE